MAEHTAKRHGSLTPRTTPTETEIPSRAFPSTSLVMHAQAVDTLQRRVRITVIALVLSASPTAHAAQPTTKISRLMAWLEGQPGGSVGPVRFGPSNLGGAGSGCGAFATRDLRVGELLLALPATALLTVGPDDELQSLAELVGDRAALAGTLARELLRGDASPLAAYTACLPRNLEADDEAMHPLWWTTEELAFLRGTSAAREILDCPSNCMRVLTTAPLPLPTGTSAAREIRALKAEVQSLTRQLTAGVLAGEVATHGEAAVRAAVLDAYVSVLSRR